MVPLGLNSVTNTAEYGGRTCLPVLGFLSLMSIFFIDITMAQTVEKNAGLGHAWQRVSVNGALSDITDVTSGVPQGSVLGPILFLPYINDINENIQSSIRLFADDSIIYRKINSNIDHQILQTDLIQLEKWSDKWQMQFNISKIQNVCTFRLQTKLNPGFTIWTTAL